MTRDGQASRAFQDAEQILRGLNPEQRAVATTFGQPVLVIAGAGTGKTRAITHRIAYGVATSQLNAQSTLAVTFTQRAAGELRERLAGLGVIGVQARTFHAAALRQLRYFWPQAYGSELPELLSSNIGLVAAAAKQHGLADDSSLLRDIASEISWAKVSNVSTADYPELSAQQSRTVADLDPELVGAVMAEYERIKRYREVIDFDDILLCDLALLHEFPQIAQRVRETYRHFTVDEFQDVNPLQWSLLQCWLADSGDLCAVGDPAQSIHAFAGAEPRFIFELAEQPDCQVLRLRSNYRSSPQILATANAIGAAANDRSPAEVQPQALLATAPAGPRVVLASSSNEYWEAQDIAGWLRELHDVHDLPWHQMAVLYRVHARSAAFENALNQLEIPYQVRDAEGFFERSEVRRFMTRLAKLAEAEQIEAAEQPPLQIAKDLLAELGWTEQPPQAVGQQRQAWESLNVLAELIEDMVSQGQHTMATLVDELGRRAAHSQAPAGRGVTLATMHAAKGLEWDAVAVSGVQEGNVPFVLATRDEQIAEERRLLYVALTRARRWLRISWNGGRSGQAGDQVSRFLAPLTTASLRGAVEHKRLSQPAQESSPRKSAARGVRTCVVCAEPLLDAADRKLGHHADCPVAFDEQLFDELRRWRSAKAAEQRVPAFVIFTDATLQAIAERAPSTRGELIKVSGVGQKKLELHADDILALVNQAAASSH